MSEYTMPAQPAAALARARASQPPTKALTTPVRTYEGKPK
jgi:hypothetical protein